MLFFYTSIAGGFLVFCGLIVWRVFVLICCKARKTEREFIPLQVRLDVSTSAEFRDSILDEPLLDK